jgi:hypothetical protein
MRNKHPWMYLERLAEGIREELDNAAHAEDLTDCRAALLRTAEISKRLRSKCNRVLLDMQRMIDETTPTP